MNTALQTRATTPTTPALTPVHAGLLQRRCACGGSPGVTGQCEECDKERLKVQRSTAQSAGPALAPPVVHEVLRSPGQPLDAGTRAFMESRLGHDFSQVRVHADARAAESARAVSASAYTIGRDVVFGAGEYSPNSSAGRRLLAHELTHVVQQARGEVSARALHGGLGVSDPDDQFERQAEQAASTLSSRPAAHKNNERVLPQGAPMGRIIQRQATRPARRGAPRARTPPVVEDGQRVAPGQMNRTDFLDTLRDSLLSACNAELAAAGRTARECPYIHRTINYYATRPLSALLRLIQAFAHPPAGADAHALIRAVTERARAVARRLAATGDQRLHAMTESEHGTLPPHDPAGIRAQLGSGRQLDGPVREQMERSFGSSFGSVRVHTDHTAARLNAELGARAFTVGREIAFAAGQYRPGTLPGDALIAHELAHTLQQNGAPTRAPGGDADRESEREADRAAIAAIAGREGVASSLQAGGLGLRIQRDGVGEVLLAAALLGGEVGGEVAVTEGVVVVTTEVAAPALVEATAPALVEAAAPTLLETTAPAALEATAPAALETTAASSSSAVSTAAATTLAVGATATLSSDSPTEQEPDPQQRCQQANPGYQICEPPRTPEQVAESFARSRGITNPRANCQGLSSFAGGVYDCGNSPGENWHCTIENSNLVVSLMGCFCCNTAGGTGFNWHPHESPGPEEEGGRGRRRQDGRGERRERERQERDRRRGRQESDDE